MREEALAIPAGPYELPPVELYRMEAAARKRTSDLLSKQCMAVLKNVMAHKVSHLRQDCLLVLCLRHAPGFGSELHSLCSAVGISLQSTRGHNKVDDLSGCCEDADGLWDNQAAP